MAPKKNQEIESDVEETPVVSKTKEATVPLSEVQKMIAEAIEKSKEPSVIKPKRVTEHHAHVWRFDNKWVVDFVDQNTDPYVKTKIHTVNKFNEQKRQIEPWIELKFHDDTTKAVPLTTYIKNRILIYCPIIERKRIDKSYVVGEVEKKKEVGDKLVGTGVLMEQTVEMYEEVLKIRTPEGDIFELPDYVLA